MSVDAWGGGSDEDPKLRKKELAKLYGDREDQGAWFRKLIGQSPRQTKNKGKPNVSVFDLLMLLLFLIGCTIGYAAFR